jgi:hypothetical protein
LDDRPELAAVARMGVTCRAGNLRLSFSTEPDLRRLVANRVYVCAALGADLRDLIIPEQTHGAGVASVGVAERGRGARERETAIPGVDALVTDAPGVLLGITIADCLPVFLVDAKLGAIGLAHSGWRGTAGAIVPATLARMREAYGTDPADVVASIGPGIGGECYEVGPEVRDALAAARAPEAAFQPSPSGRWLLDLRAIVLAQLREAGVRDEAVSAAPWCTHCERGLFFSHRGEGPGAGRMGAFIVRA